MPHRVSPTLEGCQAIEPYLFSFSLGCAVGMLYALLRIKSPAPPIVALFGLLGMMLSESGYKWFKTVVR